MPHPVDEHVGKRLRQLRKSAGFTQSAVGEALDLTFQQVQKYEKGANRISASKLYDVARLFGVSITSFYEGLPTEAGISADADILAKVATDREVAHLVRLFGSTPPPVRQQILALIEALAMAPSDASKPARTQVANWA